MISAARAGALPAGPLALCMLGCVLPGAVGHLDRSRAAIVLGIVVIGLTTAIFVLTSDPALGG